MTTAGSVELPVHRAAPARARDFARQRLRALDASERCRRWVVLVTSELVTNAVQHGRPPVVLTITVTPTHVRVLVRDCATAVPGPVRLPPAPAPICHGLEIVLAVSDAWGVRPHAHGAKSVWADVARDGTGG